MANPAVAAAVQQYGHWEGHHTHEWHRFVVRSRSFHDAADVAAVLGWWLHCWDWEQVDQDDITIEDKGWEPENG